MSVYPRIPFFDLKFFCPIGHTSATSERKEMAYEYRQNRVCSTDGLCSHLRVSPMRRALQRQLQGEDVFLLGSVPLYGLCPVDLPGKPQGYRGLPARGEDQALSHRSEEHTSELQSRLHLVCRLLLEKTNN